MTYLLLAAAILLLACESEPEPESCCDQLGPIEAIKFDPSPYDLVLDDISVRIEEPRDAAVISWHIVSVEPNRVEVSHYGGPLIQAGLETDKRYWVTYQFSIDPEEESTTIKAIDKDCPYVVTIEERETRGPDPCPKDCIYLEDGSYVPFCCMGPVVTVRATYQFCAEMPQEGDSS